MNDHPGFKRITTFVLDVDGVLTDGTVLVLENGLQARHMSVRDGFALQLAIRTGYQVVVVSGSRPSPVIERLQALGVTEIHMSVLDKKAFVEDYLDRNGLKKEEVLFMGDDLPDGPAMEIVGLPACPNDAAEEIIALADYVSPVNGGHGCVRDVIERVLKANGDWRLLAGAASR